MSTPQTVAKDFAIKILKLRLNAPMAFTSDNSAFNAVRKEFPNTPLSGFRMMVGFELSKLRKELEKAAYDAILLIKEGVQNKMAILTALGRHLYVPYSEEMVAYVQKKVEKLQGNDFTTQKQ